MREREREVVLPKLQYCRVISRLCDNGVICGRLNELSSPYDAVDKHFCNFFPPCDRDFRTLLGPDAILSEPMLCCDATTMPLLLPGPPIGPGRRPGLPVPEFPAPVLAAAVALPLPTPPCNTTDDGIVDADPHSPFIWANTETGTKFVFLCFFFKKFDHFFVLFFNKNV